MMMIRHDTNRVPQGARANEAGARRRNEKGGSRRLF